MRFLRSAVISLAAIFAAVEANTTVKQFKQRSLVDVCANVNADLNILGDLFGRIELCICLSAVSQIITTNPIMKNAALLYGNAAVTAALNNIVTSTPGYGQCQYPEHSVPFCGLNPCDFTCTDGFLPSPIINPKDCVCQAPFSVCNGICGIFLSCSSQKAKRDINWRDATCPHGWSACGVFGASRLDYECVDVNNDLWSCGGCGIPLLPTDPIGEDCTAIPGVNDVSCTNSRCVVQRCKEGFHVSEDKSSCVPTTRTSPNHSHFVENGKGPYKA